MFYVRTVDCDSVIKRNHVLVHATTWLNLENILSKGNEAQKTTCCMIPFVLYRIGKFHTNKK